MSDPKNGSSLKLFLPPDETIKKEVLSLLGVWSTSINFEYYTKKYFPEVLFEHIESQNIEATDFDKYSNSKNQFIKIEIESKSEILLEFKNIFKRYNISANPRVIGLLLKNNKLEPENETFLNILKNEDLELNVLAGLIKNRLAEIGILDLLYICGIIYFDIYKNHQFLLGELDRAVSGSKINDYVNNSESNNKINTASSSEGSEIKPIHDGAKVFESVTQAILYHIILQDENIKPHFKNVLAESENLVELYVKPGEERWASSSFNKAYYRVRNGKKYMASDYKFVQEMIYKDFPEKDYPALWERVKKYNKNEFY